MSGAKEAQVLQRRPGKRHREDIVVVCERDLGPRVLDAYDTQVLQREEGLQDFNECRSRTCLCSSGCAGRTVDTADGEGYMTKLMRVWRSCDLSDDFLK